MGSGRLGERRGGRFGLRLWRRTSSVVSAKAVLRIFEVYPSMKQFEKIAQIVSAWKTAC